MAIFFLQALVEVSLVSWCLRDSLTRSTKLIFKKETLRRCWSQKKTVQKLNPKLHCETSVGEVTWCTTQGLQVTAGARVRELRLSETAARAGDEGIIPGRCAHARPRLWKQPRQPCAARHALTGEPLKTSGGERVCEKVGRLLNLIT